ncbi:hypothetical protein HYV74_03025 [Candidatus Uhrbacteria bacterium]|nr:hypothetical protein [Candidatus Uhrbacteria bacterium]
MRHPFGALLDSKDGYFYRLPKGFRFPLACRDPVQRFGLRCHAYRQFEGYVSLVRPIAGLPHTPQESMRVDIAQLRARMAQACAPNVMVAAQNAALVDAMTAEMDGLRYLAALLISRIAPSQFPQRNELAENAWFQVMYPDTAWQVLDAPS